MVQLLARDRHGTITRGGVVVLSSAHVWHRQTKIEFPDPGTADDSAYLKAVIAADAQPSPVTRLLTER